MELIRAIRSSRQQPVIIQNTDLSPNEARRIYIFKLEQLISTPEIVQVITGLSTIPKSFRGRGENGMLYFAKLMPGSASYFAFTYFWVQTGSIPGLVLLLRHTS